MPKVTCYIPSYNLSKFIGAAIESVLSQSFTDFELLIEDDGSTDDSLQTISNYLRDPRVVLLARRENKGANWTTNQLVQRATGEFIAPLCADDVWAPDKLAKQVAYLEANPECGIVFARPRFVDERGGELYPNRVFPANRPRADWLKLLRGGNELFISTSMWRRSVHERIGYFDESLPILCDLEFYIRLLGAFDLHIMDDTLATITQRDNMANLSAPTDVTRAQSFDDMERIHEKHFPVDRSKRKILIATPFYDVKGFSPYIRSLVQTVHALTLLKIPFEWLDRSGDSYVWRARNAIADTFMRSDATELLFIDSDHGWTLESFLQLLKADEEIVGAAYPVKNNWEMFGVTIHTNEDFTPEVNDAGLIRADMVPTGFMKIKRSVFEKLKTARPDDWYWDGGAKVQNYFGHLTINHVAYGEDISFNRRWQALGGQLWVEPRCTISHIGTKSWEGNYHEFLMRQPGGSEHGNSTDHN